MFMFIYYLLYTVFYLVIIFPFTIIVGSLGFLLGILGGLVAGYFIFIYHLPLDVPEPDIPSFGKEDGVITEEALKRILPEIPIWVSNPDYDRVDWLNRFVSELWPHIDKAGCNMAKSMAAPMIEKYKPKQVESIEFEVLSLGTLPPTIAGVKVFDTTDDEVIMEMVVKMAGNPNVLVAAKAFGLKATVQLVDLTAFATVRIIMKPLVPVFPCFTRITMSLMEKPTVDFGLKLMGGDVMAIPGLYNFVQETIRNVVSGMMLWPKIFELYKAEDPTGGKRPVGWLFVSKIRVKNLRNLEAFGSSDPYVRLTLGEKFGNKHTTVKWNNLNPEWEDEEFQLVVRDPKEQVLEVQILDKETQGSDELMAVQRIPLKELQADQPREFQLELAASKNDLKAPQPDAPAGEQGKPDAKPMASLSRLISMSGRGVGTIWIELMYREFAANEDAPAEDVHGEETFPDDVPVGGGKVKVTVHNGMQLEGKSHCNPYCKVRFRDTEYKTNVVKKAADPEFDHSPFEFYSQSPPVQDTLHVQCFSKNLGVTHYISAKEELGSVSIPLRDVVTNKRINDIYQLTNSKQGKLKIEIEWIARDEKKAPASKTPATADNEATDGGDLKPTQNLPQKDSHAVVTGVNVVE